MNEWQSLRIKDVVRIISEKSNDLSLPYIALDNIVSWDATFVPSNSTSDGNSNECDSGDVLFGKLRPYLAKGYIPSEKSICSPEFLVLRPNKITYNRFLLYFLLSKTFISHIKNQVAGVKMPRTNWSQIGSSKISLPPLAEQEAIAAYLDNECGKIDKSVELLERKADAYNRLRRSLINQAVTRGLNPNAPMKPSGNDWIGDIPEHWSICRIKSLYTERVELSEKGDEDLLSVSEYYGVAKRADKVDGENISRSESLQGYKICYINDIVSNIMLAWKGSLGRTSYNGIVSPAYGVYKPIAVCNSLYYHYLFRTEIFKGIFKANSRGIIDSRLRLYTPNFLAINTLFPPKEEQDSIVAYLDEKCGKIDAIIEKIGKQIERLKELKRSLINEVVTGKRAINYTCHD